MLNIVDWGNPEPWERQFLPELDFMAFVPLDDATAYQYEEDPRLQDLYDRFLLTREQGVPCGPWGIPPTHYPVIYKPMVNLWGLGYGARVVRTREEDDLEHWKPEGFWSPFIEDASHYSVDLAVDEDEVHWRGVARGIREELSPPWVPFNYWLVGGPLPDDAKLALDLWLRRHLAGTDYRGALNVELITGSAWGKEVVTLTEVHLRPSVQWVDLYPEGFLEALARFVMGEPWPDEVPDAVDRTTGFSVVTQASVPIIEDAEQVPLPEGVRSIQRCSGDYETRSLIVNGTHLAKCLEHRFRLLKKHPRASLE